MEVPRRLPEIRQDWKSIVSEWLVGGISYVIEYSLGHFLVHDLCIFKIGGYWISWGFAFGDPPTPDCWPAVFWKLVSMWWNAFWSGSVRMLNVCEFCLISLFYWKWMQSPLVSKTCYLATSVPPFWHPGAPLAHGKIKGRQSAQLGRPQDAGLAF